MDDRINLKLLMVDDEKKFLESIAKRLELKGIQVVAVTTGQAAVEAAEKELFDVALVDFQMPGMDGAQVLKILKHKHRYLEIIMLTGHGTMETAIKAMKQGAFDFLIKPFNIDELLGNITTATQKKREHEEKIKIALKQEILSKYGPFYYT